MIKKPNTNIVIYQTKTGAIEFRGDFRKETIWATQAQIVSLFNVDQSVVSRHIKNIFKDNEVSAKSNMQKMHNAFSDKPVTLYSLDVILAVGYRTNSKVAVEFRRWATKTLREYITEGFVINKKRLVKNYENFLATVENIKQLLPVKTTIDNADILELITIFADTWLSLEAYDKNFLVTSGISKQKVKLTAEKLSEILLDFKNNLMEKNEATELFGQERQNGLVSGILGSVFQTFDGQELYKTAEEKAAHLLYFMVKNHPFVDGNKRNGAYVFIWFLRQAKILDITKLTPAALTALTILIAESNPKDKERMINLVLTLLTNKRAKKMMGFDWFLNPALFGARRCTPSGVRTKKDRKALDFRL
jgi:prophage maintenance system killer protein/prophage antirepressor-like protein